MAEGANADFSIANGCNIINTGFIASGAGVIVIDTGPSKRYGEQLRALIARTTDQPVLQVVQLSLHPDHLNQLAGGGRMAAMFARHNVSWRGA